MSRVVVVMRAGSLVKVCEDRKAFEEWMDEYCVYNRDELDVLGAKVFERLM